ncbi:MAG: HEAT repeat domain-containing protein [Planctomycetes bacterium]|nr:HEAT repeat domain-containing protein [Planctomycetota bacterium]
MLLARRSARARTGLLLALLLASGAAAQDAGAGAGGAPSREQAALRARVEVLLRDLQSSSDHSLGFISGKIDELVGIGLPALEFLAAALNHETAAPGAVNAGVNAARALGRIPGQEVTEALVRVAREGGAFGRRNAALALGLRADPALMPVLKELLAAEDKGVVCEALRALGRIGGAEARELLRGFVAAREAAVAAAAIQGLASAAGEECRDDVLARLREDLGSASPAEDLVAAALDYFTAFPAAEAVPELERALQLGNATPRTQSAAIAALRATGLAHSRMRKRVLETLQAATRVGLRATVKAAALAMLDLGDDSGVAAVTADLDFEPNRSPKNYTARYRRADLYLEFRRWREAANDLKEGLKQEKDPREPNEVYFALARAYAGMGQFGPAAKYLSQLPEQDFSSLPARYPEFAEMAADPRYARIFRPD